MSDANENFRRYEQARAKQKAERRVDRLPPANLEAEQGVLACCMMDGGCVEKVVAHAGGEAIFFDGRHQLIFDAMVSLWTAKRTIDTVTLCEELKKRGDLESVGGMHYIGDLPEGAPGGPVMIEMYLPILWEKFLARRYLTVATNAVGRIFEDNGLTESAIAMVARTFADWQALTARGNKIAPTELKRPVDFDAEYFKLWFRNAKEQIGWQLPFNFVWRGRESEMTLMTGDSGSGKSSFLGHLSVEWMAQEVPTCVASMEVPAPVTLWIMSRQLLGSATAHLPESEENRRLLAKGLAWLNARMTIYDFVGITDWRTLLDVFHYATDQGFKAFVLDSVMRIGIPEDDLAQQALAAAEFANFATKRGVHLMCVNHVNKGDGSAKRRVSGSKKWTDNANNLVEVVRNEGKHQKLADLHASLEAGEMSEDAYKSERAKWLPNWDTKFNLHKQRFPGLPQNGSKQLWFDHASLQFSDKYPAVPVDYLNA